MKQGRWICLLCVLIIFMPFLNNIEARERTFYIQARKLDDPNKTILKSSHKETLLLGEMLSVEVFVVFENKDGEYYECGLLYEDDVDLPLYFGEWQDRMIISKKKEPIDTLRNILYLRPTKTGSLKFKITALLVEIWGNTRYYGRYFQEFNLLINDIDSTLVPVLKPDSAEAALGYDSGSTKTILWKPVTGYAEGLTQDAYAFSANDPDKLLNSVRHLYRLSSLDLRKTTFENLHEGVEYCYFAKADFITDDGHVSVYSDMYRCIQDYTPPEIVQEPIIVPEPSGYRLSWEAVADTVSGVEKYIIYRASDTGAETAVHTYIPDAGPFYVWTDRDIDPEIKYYYRIRAVDRVGNMGNGVRSKAVDANKELPTTQEQQYPEDEWTDDRAVVYVPGSMDTIPLMHPINLDSVRVVSVRDDRSFFIDPPLSGMRVFNSQTITVPFPPYWVFDYGYQGSVQTDAYGNVVKGDDGAMIDLNFVNGHTYYPIIIYYYRHNRTVIDSLVPRVMDCYPPEDIRNVKVQSLVTGEEDRYGQWKMQISWDKPENDQGSPLKAFHIYRRLGEVETFKHIAELSDNYIAYVDDNLGMLTDPVNPIATYRIVAEDSVGHQRDVNTCAWESEDRVLNAPQFNFVDRSGFEAVIRDTLYTHADSVNLAFKNFDWSVPDQLIVSVNGNSQIVMNPKTGVVSAALDTMAFSSAIRLRAIYKGARSSVWSEPMIAVRDTVPPSVLTLHNHPDSSFGHIYLQWNRTSLAADKYYIYRSADGQKFTEIGSVPADRDTLEWTDRDPLSVYHFYTYKVRPFTKTGRLGPFSNEDRDYCNRPPKIVEHSVIDRQNGQFEIHIIWNRAWPIGVSHSFVTDVNIYEDYLDQPLSPGVVSTEPQDTSYTYYDGHLRHNYIFRLKEKLDDDSLNRSSGISLPYTVSLKILEMEALTQPNKKIFLAWDQQVTDTLDVSAFHLIRSKGEEVEMDTLLKPDQYIFMDQDTSLKHNHLYTYRLVALNPYDQVVAANDTTMLCDSSLVYIPTIDSMPPYFNQRLIPVCWHWEKNGEMDTTTTRGAENLILQISTKSNFPSSPAGQTVEYQFQADPTVRCGNFTIPENAGKVNKKLFLRMYAQDKWGNPTPLIESNHQTAMYDVIHPLPVDSFHVVKIKALDIKTDTVVVQLTWDDYSVLDENELISNVTHYQLLRKWDGQETVAGKWPAVQNQLTYTYFDTLPNLSYSWRIMSIDAAGNETANGWIQTPIFIETPDITNLSPIGYRSCRIHDLSDIVQEYIVEIAMFENHFQLAHELNNEQLDFLLCRSSWLSVKQDTFHCLSGWGEHLSMDTTYFRMKARYSENWESGWSNIKIYHLGMEKEGGGSNVTSDGLLPEKFVIYPNYPNPFNAVTSIQYGLPESGYVTIHVFNCRGALVQILADEIQSAGYHTCQWNGVSQFGTETASGVYVYEIRFATETGEQHRSRMKMMLLK